MRLLLAEDEKRLSCALCEILSKHTYDVDAVYDGKSALAYIASGVYDAVILDIMMPGLDGLSVLRELRAAKNNVPVLLLTAKDEIADKVSGLDHGADDYMTKPFSTDELLARIRALTRRRGEVITGCLEYGDLALDPKTCELCTDARRSGTDARRSGIDARDDCQIPSGGKIKLSLKEYRIMEMLVQNPNQILTKERILEKVWGGDSDAEYNNLEVFISFLRKKMRFIGSKAEIKTSRGIGYSLV